MNWASYQYELLIFLTGVNFKKLDYIAFQGDSDRYVRRDGVDATKSRLRLPRAETVAPDLPALSSALIDRMMRGEIDFGD